MLLHGHDIKGRGDIESRNRVFDAAASSVTIKNAGRLCRHLHRFRS